MSPLRLRVASIIQAMWRISSEKSAMHGSLECDRHPEQNGGVILMLGHDRQTIRLLTDRLLPDRGQKDRDTECRRAARNTQPRIPRSERESKGLKVVNIDTRARERSTRAWKLTLLHRGYPQLQLYKTVYSMNYSKRQCSPPTNQSSKIGL